MKQFIILAAMFSFVGISSATYAKGDKKGLCVVTNPDGSKAETESTKAECKGEFKAKPKAAKKK